MEFRDIKILGGFQLVHLNLPLEASLGTANILLICPLKAKLRAWVGKYLKQLAKLPLQKG